MGGYGSGRYGGRPSVEATNSFPLRVESLIGLRAGIIGYAAITYTSSDGDEWPVHIRVDTRDGDTGHLELRHEPRNGRDGEECYRVFLHTTRPTYGGRRWWFLCPLSWRRCGVIYLPRGGRYFASRQAYGMVYECQKEARLERLQRRTRKLNRALGGDGDEIPERPKGMWQRTYERKLARLDAIEEKANDAWLVGLMPLMRRVGIL